MRWLRGSGGSSEEWSLDGVERPWSGPSLFDLIRDQLDSDGRLLPDADDLPDAPEMPHGMRFAPGALDGVFGGTIDDDDGKRRIRIIRDALAKLVDRAEPDRLRALYETLKEDPILGLVDETLDGVRIRSDHVGRLAEIGRLLSRQAAHREPVKFGLAIVGRTGDLAVDQPVLMTLGAHEEFTLFVVVALSNLDADERTFWALARRVTGWGRIQIVQRLSNTGDPDIRRWMLRDGYRNEVMNEYLAYICATTGELADALAEPEIGDDLFRGATEILSALANGGPAEDLGDYADANRAVTSWLGHVDRRPMTIEVVSALDDIAGAKTLAPAVSARIETLRDSESTLAVIRAGLASDDPQTFASAHIAGRPRGIDDRERLFEFAATGDPYAIFELFREIDESSIDSALDLIRGQLDLGALASGPGMELGLDRGQGQMGLEDAVNAVEDFPDRGLDFVLSALRNPVIRVRHAALRTLQHWGPSHLTPEIITALTAAQAVEPDDEVRAHIERTLAGEPWVEPEIEWPPDDE